MNRPTDLHDPELEDRLRSLLHERALTVGGVPPVLPDPGRTSAVLPLGSPTPSSGSRRWASVGIAAALLTAGAAGVVLARPDSTETVTSVATTPVAPAHATPAETRVLVVNGSRWEGPVVLELATASLTDLGIGHVATEEAASEVLESAVYYRAGFEAVASQVAFQTYMTGQETPLPTDLLDLDADVVVRLGQDWDPFAADEPRGDVSSLPYVPATVSDTVQLAGPPAWPGPGNDADPADTPVAVVRSFLARVIGVDAAKAAVVQELYQYPLDGYTTALVKVVLPSGEETEARLGLTDGQDRWVLSAMVSTTGNDDPWGGVTGPMPLAEGNDAGAVEKAIAYPEGATSARIWYRHGDGPTMQVELDHAVLEAGYQNGLEDYGDGPGPDSPIQLGSDRASLGSAVLLQGTATKDYSYVGVFYDEQGAPITVYADSFYVE